MQMPCLPDVYPNVSSKHTCTYYVMCFYIMCYDMCFYIPSVHHVHDISYTVTMVVSIPLFMVYWLVCHMLYSTDIVHHP